MKCCVEKEVLVVCFIIDVSYVESFYCSSNKYSMGQEHYAKMGKKPHFSTYCVDIVNIVNI